MPQASPSSSSMLSPEHQREARLGLWLVLLFVSAMAMVPGPSGIPSLLGWDKVDHISAFAAMTLLARLGWPRLGRITLSLLLLLHGGLIELAQTLPIVSRTSSLADLAADGIGIAAGLVLAAIGARLWGQLARWRGRGR